MPECYGGIIRCTSGAGNVELMLEVMTSMIISTHFLEPEINITVLFSGNVIFSNTFQILNC